MRRQWARVRRTQNSVFGGVDHGGFFSRSTPPQHKHQSGLSFVQHLNDAIGESFPPLTPMTVGLMGSNRQHRIQQQHSLIGPMGQLTVSGNRHANARVQLFENVLQRWGRPDTPTNREAQPVGLAFTVVRILTQHDHSDAIKRGAFKRFEHLSAWWKDRVLGLFFHQK